MGTGIPRSFSLHSKWLIRNFKKGLGITVESFRKLALDATSGIAMKCQVALVLAFLLAESFSFPFRSFFDIMEENLDNVADQILKDLSIGLPQFPMLSERNVPDRIHMKFIPNRIFIGRMPFSAATKKSFGGKTPGKKTCARRLLNERQSLPIPILPKSSLIAARYANQNMYPLGLLPASEAAAADTWTWVDNVRFGGQVKKLVIAGLLGRSVPLNFEPLCLVPKTESLEEGDVALPFSFPPVMSSQGFLNEHNSKLVLAGKGTERSSSRHCLAFTSDTDPTPLYSSQVNHVPPSGYVDSYGEPPAQQSYEPAQSNATHDGQHSPMWTFEEEYNEIATQHPQVAPQGGAKPPSLGFPSPPGYQLSLVNPSVYKSYGPSSDYHLIGVVARRQLRFLDGFLELPQVDFSSSSGKQYGDLEAAGFFKNLWADHGLVVRVNNAQAFPDSFQFVILFRADHAARLEALNATVWPIHVQLDGPTAGADYQLAHVPNLTYGSHELLDSLYLLLTAIPQPWAVESKSNALPIEYEMPAYPGAPAPQDASLENDATTLETGALESSSNNTSTSQQSSPVVQLDESDSTVLASEKKPLPSKKSWKYRAPQSSRGQSASDLNRVAREILAFLGTNL